MNEDQQRKPLSREAARLRDVEKTHAAAGHNTMPINRREVFGDIVVRHTAYLQVSGLPGGQRNVELGQDETEIGRTNRSDFQLDLPGVSRFHARLYFQNDEYHIEDLDSTNGTFVNGVRISRCVLRNNDVIQIGEAKIRFVEERTHQAPDPSA